MSNYFAVDVKNTFSLDQKTRMKVGHLIESGILPDRLFVHFLSTLFSFSVCLQLQMKLLVCFITLPHFLLLTLTIGLPQSQNFN